MASSVTSVVVLGPRGRRYSHKVTPNTSILQVLEEACKKEGINPSDFDLKHGNRVLDLSIAVRFSNIPNNALLELHPASKIRKEGNVTVGVQLESGERLMGDFSPSSSIWDVVCRCLSQRNETLNHGDDGSSVPVCVYMRQMIVGKEMKEKTLRSLGLTDGKAMFRFFYREAGQPMEQAHVSTRLTKSTGEVVSESGSSKCDLPDQSLVSEKHNLVVQEEKIRNVVEIEHQNLNSSVLREDSSSRSTKFQADDTKQQKPFLSEHSIETTSSVPGNKNVSESDRVPSAEENEIASRIVSGVQNPSLEYPMDVDLLTEDSEEVEGTGTITIIGERNAVLFTLDDVTGMPKIDLPDEFYEVTAEDIVYLMQEYKRVRLELENKPLELQSQKENENLKRLSRYAQTVIRIQFPDRLVLQGVFSVDETVKSVMEFVQGFLEDEALNFYLYTSPPKTNLSQKQTLLESKLLPAAVIYFGCGKYLNSYVKPSYRTQLSDPRAVSKAASDIRSKNVASISSDIHSIHIDENVNVEVHPQQNLDVPSTSSSECLQRTHHTPPAEFSKVPKWLKLSKK